MKLDELFSLAGDQPLFETNFLTFIRKSREGFVEVIMKNNNFSKLELFKANSTWWIVGLVLAFPGTFLLQYFVRRIYPSQIDDMGHAQVQQLQLELVVLAILNVITPTVVNAIGIFYTELIQSGNRGETKRSNFSLSFTLAGIKRPIPRMLTVVLVVAEVSFITSMMIYLKQNYYTALDNSVASFLGWPGPMFLAASLLLAIDYSLIFCLLVFSFLWGYSWVRWASDRIFPRFLDNKYHSQTLLLASLIFRAVNMLGLVFVINFMVTFSGKFDTVVKIIFRITLFLLLWIGIYIMPYWRERAAFRKDRLIMQ